MSNNVNTISVEVNGEYIYTMRYSGATPKPVLHTIALNDTRVIGYLGVSTIVESVTYTPEVINIITKKKESLEDGA